MNSTNCPVCNELYVESFIDSSGGRKTLYKCIRCGDFFLTSTAQRTLPSQLLKHPNGPALLSHSILKMQGDTPPTLFSETIEAILANSSLPSLKEQENNIVLYLGNNSTPGRDITRTRGHILAVVGSIDFLGLDFMMAHLKKSELVTELRNSLGEVSLILNMKGWERYEEIRRGNIDSKKAFMAMPFGNQKLDEIYKHFKNAIAQTGFDLQRIDEKPKAGLIDDRLRVEIRTSRFLIAELTEENRGAYWEAGFAEGMGRPVIYSCEKTYFKQAST
ncbi:MAG: hypothetical protein ABSD50_15535 [Smithella sp.]